MSGHTSWFASCTVLIFVLETINIPGSELYVYWVLLVMCV